MYKLLWDRNKFQTEQYLTALHWIALKKEDNRIKIVNFLNQCRFTFTDYICSENNEVFIVKSEDCTLCIEDEGTGFNIMFHLLGYILTGENIEVVDNSIVRYLHPNLYRIVKETLTENNCTWLSPGESRMYLKCAVNPLGDCNTCEHFEPDNNQKVVFR